jgi:hypothetical protein
MSNKESKGETEEKKLKKEINRTVSFIIINVQWLMICKKKNYKKDEFIVNIQQVRDSIN